MSRQILVALDSTGAAERLLPWVSRIARGWGAAVHLAVICLPVTSVVGRWSDGFVEQEQARVHGEALARLPTLAGRLEDDGVAVSTTVRFGDPVETILALARECRAALIALPAAARTPWIEIVNEEVLRRSAVPVLIAPGGDRPAA
jgi:nucleotide-binding universal stress UspA family protein